MPIISSCSSPHLAACFAAPLVISLSFHRLQSLSSFMSLRSSRPRLMMHVFFAPRLFLIPLSSLSYDRRFVVFFCLIHYTARPHVVYVEFFCLALLRQLLWCSIGIRDHRGDPTTVTLLISCSHFCIEFSWVGVACRGTPLHSM